MPIRRRFRWEARCVTATSSWLGSPMFPPRKAVRSAEDVLDAVVDIQANLRRELVLANLFASLGSDV